MTEVTRGFWCITSNLFPCELSSPDPWLYTLNHEKMCIKAEIEDIFYTPPQKKVAGYYVIPSKNFEIFSVRQCFLSGL